MIVAHYTHSVVFGSFLEKLLSFQYTENEQPPTLYSFAAFAMHRYTSFLTFFCALQLVDFRLVYQLIYKVLGSLRLNY